MMTNFNYSLVIEDYSWKNAILWGNFSGHCQKAMEGTFGDRIVHVLIAAIEFLPIIGQIASIFEKIIVTSFSNPVQPEVDLNPVESKVDLNPVESKVDLNPVEPKVDLNPVESKVDLNPVEPKVDLKPSDESITVLSGSPVLSDEDKEIVKFQVKIHEIRERKRILTEEFNKDSDPKELSKIYQEAKDKYQQCVENHSAFIFRAQQVMKDSEPDERLKWLTFDFTNQIRRVSHMVRSAFNEFNRVALNFPQRKAILDSYRDEFGDMVPVE